MRALIILFGVVVLAAFIAGTITFYGWLVQRVLRPTIKSAQEARDKARHGLEEALEVDDIVHYLSEEERYEYQKRLDKIKDDN